MKCSKCGRENAAGVRFCVFCGAPLAVVKAEEKAPAPKAAPAMPSPPPSPIPAGPPSAPAMQVARELPAPAPRPLGVVLIAILQFFTGLGWLLFGQLLYLSQFLSLLTLSVTLAAMERALTSLPLVGPLSARDWVPLGTSAGEANRILLLIALLTVLIMGIGLLSIAGSIGLWLLTSWGRRVVLYLQAPMLVMNMILLLGLAFNRVARESGLLAGLIIWPFIGIFVSLFVMFYLINPNLNRWFREA
jgi:hypothetical protein